jgi:glycosyltransferase involved in cell wall biosynthesis
MKIAFLLCSPDINGGTYVIFEHSVRLAALGHIVYLITQNAVAPERYAWHPEASSLQWITLTQAEQVSFDCIIATWWESPFLLHALHASHYVYFVQSIESRFFPAENPLNHDLRDHSVGASRADNSYFFSLPIITEARWIKDFLRKRYNHHPILVRNGIRKDIYTTTEVLSPRQPGQLRVLVEGPVDVFHKNVPRTIELCRQSDADEIWLLTSSAIEAWVGVDRVFSRIPVHETPAIYRSCDVLVKLSYVEGMFGPPLEMFHCGGTAIVYDVTGYDEYIEHGVNSFVVRQDDERQVVSYLNELREKREILQKLCQGAAKTAHQWPDWSESAQQFADSLETICAGPTVSREYLQNITEHLIHHQHLQLQQRDLERFAQGERAGGDVEHPRHNFIQIYYNAVGAVDDSGFAWNHYQHKDIDRITVTLKIATDSLRMRIDPTVRIGIVLLYQIRILSSVTRRVLAEFSPGNGFDTLTLVGTGRWLDKGKGYWILEAFGNDPQLFLPEISCNGENDLCVELHLAEMGFADFIEGRILTAVDSGAFARRIRSGCISIVRRIFQTKGPSAK